MIRSFVLLNLIVFTIQAAPVVLITGASKGIGRKTAELLVNEGYTVYGGSRTICDTALFHQLKLDITNDQSVHDAVAHVIAKEGRIDVLINNAGTVIWGSVESLTIEEAKQIFEVNFFGSLRMTQAVLPIMREQKSGRIIQLSSRSGYRPLPSASIYAASKFALEGLSETMAATLKAWNIHVSLIEPGPVNTEFDGNGSYGTNLKNDPYREIFDKAGLFDPHSPLMQEPEEIASVIKQAVEDEVPLLRYQTSEPLRIQAAKRFTDVTGQSSVIEFSEVLFPKE